MIVVPDTGGIRPYCGLCSYPGCLVARLRSPGIYVIGGGTVSGRVRKASAWLSSILVAALAGSLATTAGVVTAADAATPPQLNLKILLIGEGSADVTTAAWEAALTGEGVPYTEVTASGTAPNETVTLPTLSSGNTGNYNGVVIADSPDRLRRRGSSPRWTATSPRSASARSTATCTRRQRWASPTPRPAPLDGTTGHADRGRADRLPAAQGPHPVRHRQLTATAPRWTPGRRSRRSSPTPPGTSLAGVYQHPSGDPQAGVAELALNFDYNANQLQWLLLAPGLINWVTQDTHLGPVPQLLRPGHRRQLHRRQRVELAVPVHPGRHRPARLHLPDGRPGRGARVRPGRPGRTCR